MGAASRPDAAGMGRGYPLPLIEVEGWPEELRPEHLCRQAVFADTWDDRAAAFRSPDELLARFAL